ncbi:MAG: NAD-dependent epimerase/dehydratase family protein [Proteobacteria bacterium]|nr:NAD-dependent epimerase/dehydratase family protein [Pseudomonadota bacterium]
MTKKKKVVTVTGATGFVGRHVVERLLKNTDLQVRALIHSREGALELQPFADSVTFIRGDITKQASLAKAFRGAWGVINIAGYREFWSASNERFYEINQQGALNVFECCLTENVEKVDQVSTPLAWGVPEKIPFNEESAPGQHPSNYARSKYLGDEAGWHLYRQRNLPLTAVYLAAVIGAGDDKETMEVRRAVEGKLPALVGADTTYTYVYVRDAAEAIVRALLDEKTIGRKYLIGNQRATTREYFKMIGRIAGVRIPDRNIPETWLFPIAKGMEALSRLTKRRPTLPLDVLKTTAAGSLLFNASRSVTELDMTYTSLETALTEAIADIRRPS